MFKHLLAGFGVAIASIATNSFAQDSAQFSVGMAYINSASPYKDVEATSRALPYGSFESGDRSDLMFETKGVCAYLLEDYEAAISTFKNMQIETRVSLFYSAACYGVLGKTDLAKDRLSLAKNESGMDIDKFVATQLYQSDEISNKLKSNLLSIEEGLVVS